MTASRNTATSARGSVMRGAFIRANDGTIPTPVEDRMKTLKPALAVCAAGALIATAFAGRPSANGAPTKLLRMPTVSATQIAFAYANNIWTVERAGGNARRLTSFQGQT